MYARITHFHVYESELEELERRLAKLCTSLHSIDGLIDAYSAWRDDGQGISIAFYDNEDCADKAALEVQSMWASFDDMLSAPIQVSTYQTAVHLTFGT
ncbi:MAG: hypothetical protein AAF543_05655 [Pseudomonadota bacterium]